MFDLHDVPTTHRIPVLRSLIRIEQLRADHHLGQAAEADEGSVGYHEHLAAFARAGERAAELQTLLSAPSPTQP